ncbi:conserved protein of unknown function (Host attachment protein,7-143) [Magnetospirillum sp. XM-1]|uniref:host attachment protein n=1 Tax=Magnetospirillum sp. XM-1 TaxID=1663591 RepID=UPI00073DDD7E|nr:host attachment protein [Magnetospirillum sp. XM-1]CUW38649.1 conserved protein of unknown function (Host attachment protein,7-143) [Magnetospirillum sp. XM-1]
MPKPCIWICVADGTRARFFHCDGPGRDIVPALNYMLAAPSRAHNISMTADRPGRTFDSAGAGRHAYDEGDWQDEEKGRFAGRVAAQLDRAALDHQFERLVVVAPPAMMGELRKHFTGIRHRMEVVEVVKDLTHATPREMQSHLSEALRH